MVSKCFKRKTSTAHIRKSMVLAANPPASPSVELRLLSATTDGPQIATGLPLRLPRSLGSSPPSTPSGEALVTTFSLENLGNLGLQDLQVAIYTKLVIKIIQKTHTHIYIYIYVYIQMRYRKPCFFLKRSFHWQVKGGSCESQDE